MNFPDKSTYKTTVSKKLREDLRDLIVTHSLKTYLEIGCDVGYTMHSISDDLTFLTGIDKDSSRVKNCKENLIDIRDKSQILVGTSEDIPTSSYDLVLIDADHSYDFVKMDYQRVLNKNTSMTYFVVFHDYGLTSGGVKKFVDENFETFSKIGMSDNWNPLGGSINDSEAVIVRVQRKND
jgi:hypothetical protein